MSDLQDCTGDAQRRLRKVSWGLRPRGPLRVWKKVSTKSGKSLEKVPKRFFETFPDSRGGPKAGGPQFGVGRRGFVPVSTNPLFLSICVSCLQDLFRYVPICCQKKEQIKTNQGNPFLPTPFCKSPLQAPSNGRAPTLWFALPWPDLKRINTAAHNNDPLDSSFAMSTKPSMLETHNKLTCSKG